MGSCDRCGVCRLVIDTHLHRVSRTLENLGRRLAITKPTHKRRPQEFRRRSDVRGRVPLEATFHETRPLTRTELTMIRSRAEQVRAARTLRLEIESGGARLLLEVLMGSGSDEVLARV